jgi:formate dehydrogenase subunit gamma
MFGRSVGHEPQSHRFNAGEKLAVWGGVLAPGSVVVASGLVMDRLVLNLAYERGTMQVTHMVHNASAILMMCVFAAHIYIGRVGMRGTYTAMRRGWVGDAWAKEHHACWHEQVRVGKVPAQRSRPGTKARAATSMPASG